MLTLAEARKTGRLSEFIAQEQSRGVPSVDASDFESLASIVVKAQKQQDQTSGSPVRGGSSGKKIR